MKEKECEISMTTKEEESWIAIKDGVWKFLCNYSDPDYMQKNEYAI